MRSAPEPAIPRLTITSSRLPMSHRARARRHSRHRRQLSRKAGRRHRRRGPVAPLFPMCRQRPTRGRRRQAVPAAWAGWVLRRAAAGRAARHRRVASSGHRSRPPGATSPRSRARIRTTRRTTRRRHRKRPPRPFQAADLSPMLRPAVQPIRLPSIRVLSIQAIRRRACRRFNPASTPLHHCPAPVGREARVLATAAVPVQAAVRESEAKSARDARAMGPARDQVPAPDRVQGQDQGAARVPALVDPVTAPELVREAAQAP